VLITVLLVMIALLGLGVTALWLTSGNMSVGASTNLRNQALYVAEVGIERVRNDLNRATPPAPYLTVPEWKTALLNGKTASAPRNFKPTLGVYASPPDMAGKPDGVGVIYYEGNTALDDLPWPPVGFDRGAAATARMGTYTVWIRNDTAELRQIPTKISADDNNTMVVRSEGVAADGKTRVVLEVTMGPGSTPSNAAPVAPATPPVLCNSGKNACDENSSTQSGVVVQ